MARHCRIKKWHIILADDYSYNWPSEKNLKLDAFVARSKIMRFV